jgi:hypothetical protein
MPRRHRNNRTRLFLFTASLFAASACVPALAMTGGESGGLNTAALFGGLASVLGIGLYLQSTRRRTI